ncbi:TerB family tellurite resistance protein [Paracrocinitomix mangrovi]|uniref:tellurite resistance TerB family protein n=1 Tax=Paracrocinitomix mangrovi TaxID=2862509 RepID=UPI001C8D40D6|nr:TerB family tellurite resistance protein [Paracrocinitomix mangrovi]UKN00399.1 TerB family tellurite resistance protein [Paracrocinitomix mangrovi]
MSFPEDIDFIQQLARMLYTAGQIDGDFSRDEKKASLSIIHQLSQKNFGEYAEQLMINEIKDLVENNSSSADLIQDFKQYYHQHKNLFTDDIKTDFLKTIDAVVYAHSKRNKSELTLLSQLEILFFGIKVK